MAYLNLKPSELKTLGHALAFAGAMFRNSPDKEQVKIGKKIDKLLTEIEKQIATGVELKLYQVLCDSDDGNTVDTYLTEAEQIDARNELMEGYDNNDELYDNTGKIVDIQDEVIIL